MNLNRFKNRKCILSCVALLFLLFSFCSPKEEEDKYKSILKSIYRTLSFLHYHAPEVDEKFSEGVYKKYLESLDPQKLYFLESEIAEFSSQRKKLGDAFINGNTEFFNLSITHLQRKIVKLEALSKKILSRPFDFSKEESITLDENNNSYAKNIQQWEDQWRKYLKYLTLIEMTTSKKEDEKEKPENSNAISEASARKRVLENMTDYFRQFKMKKKSDLFSVYINAITAQYDPHTAYFSAKEKEDFDFRISGQLEGIGAVLQDKKGYATIAELIAGGPAWKSKKIEVGDKILKVAQGKYGKSKSIPGLLLSDSIRLIRGKKGSIVRLTLQKKDGHIEEVSLVRDIIEQKETFAKGAVLEDKDKNSYGYIYLPEFYFNPNDKNGRNAASDLRKEIEQLKEKNIEGLVLDLRNNSGGSLETAVDITGLFIGKGPVVQVRRNDGKKETLSSNIESPLWKGPIVVLVNEASASASEILAGALQDYKRALIIGGPQTYGKGTVQTVYPLDRFTLSEKNMGALKFTISKFYRVSGSSTQLKGVQPDLIIPGRFSYTKFGEKDQENPLEWDSVEAVPYELWENQAEVKNIKEKVENRIHTNPDIKVLDKLAQNMQILQENKTAPLQWKKFQADKKEREEKNKAFDSLKNYTNGLTVTSVSGIHPLEKSAENQEKEWKKNMGRDIYLGTAIETLRAYK